MDSNSAIRMAKKPEYHGRTGQFVFRNHFKAKNNNNKTGNIEGSSQLDLNEEYGAAC